MVSCGGDSPSLSPSTIASIGPGTSLSTGPADYHDAPAPLPEPAPAPDPMPDPAPPADPVPAPNPAGPLTIGIVGSFGAAAFVPNPLEATVGTMLVWTNNDLAPHHIVLSDGTVVGTLLPGETSAAIPMTTPSVDYACTFHPSMVGGVSDPSAAPPAAPPPGSDTLPPSTDAPLPPDTYPPDDGYDDDDDY
jgi:plastocyanin